MEGSNGLFVLRTVVGMLLALAIAFRLDLSTPGSAAVTVSIIALPQTGMVLEKSFYRLLGTLLGAIVTLILVATLVQQRDTFILAVALWIGLCTAASTWFRGFQAYGWLLCGYTTCLIGFPAFMDAPHAFDIAVDRVTIVSVGILSAGFVNAIILPLRSTTNLVQVVRRSFVDFVAFVDAATRVGDGAGIRRAQHQFSRDLANLESIRAASVFEDPSTRIRSRRLRGFIGGFMFASSRLHLLHRQLDSVQAAAREDILAAIEPALTSFRGALRAADQAPTSALEAAPVVGQLEELLRQWTAADSARIGSNRRGDAALVTTRALLRESAQETLNLTALYANLHSTHRFSSELPYGRPRIHADALQAATSGARAALLVIVTCAFWITSAWPEGFSMTLLAVVGCALFSSAPDPARAALQMCKGFAIGFPALIACYTWVLPVASDFDMLALGLLPFLAFGAWLMTRPGQALAGSGYFLLFLTGIGLTGLMSYDFVGMINNVVGLLIGIIVSTLSLAVIVSADRTWRPKRARQLLLGCLRMTRTEPLRSLQARFEHRVRDMTIQLIGLRPAGFNPDEDELLGLVLLEMGEAVIRLRRAALQLPDTVSRGIARWIDTLITAVAEQNTAALAGLDDELQAFHEHLAKEEEDRSDESASLLVALSTLRLAIQDFDRAPSTPHSRETAYAT